MLDAVPEHLWDDRGLVMALIIYNGAAWDYASDTLRQDAMIIKLRELSEQTARFADLTLIDASKYFDAIRVSLGSVADDVHSYMLSERLKHFESQQN